MASALQEELNCSICLNIYKDPVILKCGHNFCRVCIDRVLNTQEGSGVYSCPDCREQFQERPVLFRNRSLCNIAERFLSAYPGQEETRIFCTYCIHSSVPAVKSCVMCEASLCDSHLSVHSKSAQHVLTEPSNALRTRKCSLHMKILEYYCTEDAACTCVTCCLAGVHRGHKVEQLNEASKKKLEKLRNILEKLLSKNADAEKKEQSLQERRREVQTKATGERERVTALFRDIRRQLEDLEKRVLHEISSQEDKISTAASYLIQQLGITKEELSRKMHHIEELCNMTDPVTVLQEQESEQEDFFDTEEGDNIDRPTNDMNVNDIGGLDTALISVILDTGLADIVASVKGEVQDNSHLIFDVHTASGKVHLKDNCKSISWARRMDLVPETPQMFQVYPQVLCKRRLSSGKHFFDWEVRNIDSGSCIVGMCYPSIDRKGDQSCLGFNNKSWCLRQYYSQYSVIHDSNIIYLPHNPSHYKFRLYLDYEAGQLSFYELCEPIRHLYTFTTTFTEPLLPAFYIFGDYINITITNSNIVQSYV